MGVCVRACGCVDICGGRGGERAKPLSQTNNRRIN